jgi:HK97 gp10 family phage protein
MNKQAYYGKFPEFGTRTQAAQPFLGPAAASEMPRFIANLKKGTEEAAK